MADIQQLTKLDMTEFGMVGEVILGPPSFRKMAEMRNALGNCTKTHLVDGQPVVDETSLGYVDIIMNLVYIRSAPFKTDLEGLPLHATASLFGKVRETTPSNNDVALGIICMVLESIGSAAVLSKLNTGVKDFVLIGNLTRLPQCAVVFPRIEEIYGVKFHIPAHAEFCTALGAALAFTKQ